MTEIQRILVVGAGVMGHGIALVCARTGLNTDLVDVDAGILQRAISKIERFLKGSVERQKMTSQEAHEIINRINALRDLEDVAPRADMVIEAVVEDQEIKANLFKQLNELCPPSVIFASNTSQISITELGHASGRPDRFVGMHWFNPPTIMRLIEIPMGMETTEETVETVKALAHRLDKEPMVCKDSPGFVVNRILNVWYNEAMRLLDEGVARMEEIDSAIRDGGGFRMGPLELRDLVGLDVGLMVTESLYRRLGHEKFRPPECLRQRVAAGHLGRKTGKGFYTYEDA
jgi:3-hydroxybutyryl-CoA dehydrogenase